MTGRLFTVPNVCSAFRLVVSPLLIALAIIQQRMAFAIFFGAALLSDALDGILARRLRLDSEAGACLDSWSDLALYSAAAVGLAVLIPRLIREELVLVGIMTAGYAIPFAVGWARWQRLTSYHTWGAKVSAMVVGPAMLLMLGVEDVWPLWVAAPIFLASAVEDVLITVILPRWQANVPSLWHALRIRKQERNPFPFFRWDARRRRGTPGKGERPSEGIRDWERPCNGGCCGSRGVGVENLP